MKTLNLEAKRTQKLILIVAAGIALSGTPLYAEETTDPVSTVVQAATDAITNSTAATATTDTQATDAAHPRREAFNKWLEEHPKAKEHLDKNGDGTVDG